MSRIKQDDTISRAATLSKLQSSAPANDNDGDGAWPLLPFPESASPPLSYQEVTTTPAIQTGLRSSWKATLSRLAYLAAVSMAMLGWSYLLVVALISSVMWIVS